MMKCSEVVLFFSVHCACLDSFFRILSNTHEITWFMLDSQMTRLPPHPLLRQQQPSPRLQRPAGLCFPKQVSRVFAPQVSAPAACLRAAWRHLASSGAPACPLSPRPILLTAHRVTPAEQLTVSQLKSVDTTITTRQIEALPCTRLLFYDATFTSRECLPVNFNADFITTLWYIKSDKHLSAFVAFHCVFPDEYSLHKQPPPTCIMLGFAFSLSSTPPAIYPSLWIFTHNINVIIVCRDTDSRSTSSITHEDTKEKSDYSH